MADSILGGIVINEILVDPNGANNFDTDGNGTAAATDEFVELLNTSGAPIDISGVELWDAGNGNWFTFPPGTILQPGGHAMVMAGVQAGGSLPTGGPDDLFFDAGRGSAVINNGGDNVVVYDPGADQFIQATFNGDPQDNPPVDYAGFSPTATRSGAGENFGNDQDGFSIQRTPDGGNTFVNNQTPTPGTSNICFTQGTLFATPFGPRRIETLKPGDLLNTQDHGAQRIKWIWSRKRSAEEIRANAAFRAIRIEKGALGRDLPHETLHVSQQHRVLIASRIAQRMFGVAEILVPAKDLLAVDGVEVARPAHSITYYHILMQQHEILFANGVPAESLYLGKEALEALDPAASDALHRLLGLHKGALRRRPAPARHLTKGRRVHRLVMRHLINGKPFTSVSDMAQ